jgi:hypothetical protein
MNLLDDPSQVGALSLGLRLLSTPGKFGQALGQAGLGAMGDVQQAKAAQDMKRQKALQEQMLMMQLEQIKAQQQRQQGIEGAYRGAIESPATQALAGGGGPTVANAQAMQGMTPRVNQSKLIEGLLGADPIAAYQMMQPKERELLTVAPGASVLDRSDPTKALFTAPKELAPDEFTNILTRAGIDPASPEGRAMYRQLAQRKVAPPAPAALVNVNTPFESAFAKASGAKFADAYDQMNTAGMQASQTVANLDRMAQLLEGVEGGRLAPTGKEIASIAGSFGIKLDPKLGNKEAAEALAVEMALAMRPPGSGPMTDKDFANFLLTVPGLSKTAEGRKQITTTLRAKAERDMKMAELAQQYVQQNGVMDTGFYGVAQQFIMKNPVVAPSAPRPTLPSIDDIEAEIRRRGGR